MANPQVKFCPSCGKQNNISSTHCTNCGAPQPTQASPQPTYAPAPTYYAPPVQDTNVSSLWYLAALLFGLLGGGIGWYLNRKKNPGKARNILIVGVVSWVIQYAFLLA